MTAELVGVFFVVFFIFESLLYCQKFFQEQNYDVCNNQKETLFIKLDLINKNSNESNSLLTKTNLQCL